MNYADHEADRAKARDALRRAITAEIVARYEGLHDKDAFDVLDIVDHVVEAEETLLEQMKMDVVGDVVMRYPVDVPV